MDYRQLESFVAIVNFESFSDAAKSLYLAQPTISNHLKSLEDELHVVLIQRNSWGIQLTEEGRLLYDYAKEVLEKKKTLVNEINKNRVNLKGQIEIHASSIPEMYLIPEIVARFKKLEPEITFSLRHSDSQEVIEMLKSDEITFGFTGVKESHSDLSYTEISRDEILFLGPSNEERNSVTLQEFQTLPLILREEGSGHRTAVESILNRERVSLESGNVTCRCENATAIKEMVKHGLGYSFLSKIAVQDELEKGTLKAIQIENLKFTRSFYFVYNKKKEFSVLERRFQDFVLSMGEIK